MDFAKKILNKYGWKEGDGLGKTNDGIVKPLKASLKFDTAGFGADQAASDFNNHWWERVFNEAAQNVQINSEENGTVSMNLKNSEDGVEISTKGYSLKKLKKAKAKSADGRYDNFLTSATLTSAGSEVVNPFKIAEDDIAVTSFKTLTDEELFQACGGRTAHKGARHGLKLSGKLARIERQEKELMAQMLSKQYPQEVKQELREISPTTDLSHDISATKLKKRKKEKNKFAKEVAELREQQEELAPVEKKTSKKQKKKTDLENITVQDTKKPSKKLKKNSHNEDALNKEENSETL